MITRIFIEALEDQKPRVTFLHSEFVDGLHRRFYAGPSGFTVMFDTTEDELDELEVHMNLIKMGLSDLIPFFIPGGYDEPDAVAGSPPSH